MSEQRVSICNVKGAFSIRKDVQRSDFSTLTLFDYKNFSVLKSKYIYSIFWCSGYVNVTKIKKYDDRFDCLEHFEKLTSIKPITHSFKVHSIFANGKIHLKNSLNELKLRVEENKSWITRCTLNRSIYPALIIKDNTGTGLFYQSGKFTLLGFKNPEEVSEFYSQICVLIKTS